MKRALRQWRLDKEIVRPGLPGRLRAQVHGHGGESAQDGLWNQRAAGLWRIHNFLAEKRNEMDDKYDCSYSLLFWFFSRLMVEGGISEEI